MLETEQPASRGALIAKCQRTDMTKSHVGEKAKSIRTPSPPSSHPAQWLMRIAQRPTLSTFKPRNDARPTGYFIRFSARIAWQNAAPETKKAPVSRGFLLCLTEPS
jgi:hypothetical protein